MTASTLSLSVIPSKIELPAAPSNEVDRPRLETVLDGEHQVVMVTAPPGYGKSTFVAAWARRSRERCIAWVSLDPLDRSAMSFWRHVVASVVRCTPAAREADAILVERGQPGPEFAAALAHALWDDGRPVVLVIDDLQWADPVTVREVLAPLVDNCRGVLRLIAIGRSDPPLPTHRWRAEGRAAEVRLEDLAFERDEAVALMARFDLAELERDDVERLNTHVEGWVVGLLLSGLALDGRPDLVTHLDELIASDRHLTGYLVDEVLERLPGDLREFALTLSVPPTFDEELARQLTGRTDAGALMDRLVRSNPFVTSTVAPPAYRFHHLLRSLLATTLRWTDPAAFERAHRQTAQVMVRRGHIADALASLLEIGDVDQAFDLVTEPALRTNDSGLVRELAQWLEMLGDVQIHDHERALSYTLALTLSGRLDQALEWVGRARALSDPTDDRLGLLQQLLECTVLGAAGCVADAARALPAFDGATGDVHDSRHLDSRMSVQLARFALASGDLQRAERWIAHADTHPEQRVSKVAAPALGSWLHLCRGDVPGALEIARDACVAAARLGLRPNIASFDALLSLGWAQMLAGRSDELAATLDALDEDADAVDLPFVLLRLWPLQVMSHALREGWPAALEFARTLDPDAYPRRGGELATCHDELLSRALLNCGLDGEAAPIVERLPDGTRRSLLVARRLLVAGQRDEIARVLAGNEQWRVLERIEALLLLAQASVGPTATKAITDALELGRTCGAIAPFAVEGRRVERLLGDVPVDNLFPALAEHQRSQSARPGSHSQVDIVEPLTAKELAVLALLPSHATYRAIGAQLYVSVNTVKTYVRSVYRKLGASSRAEAVDTARRVGLLPE